MKFSSITSIMFLIGWLILPFASFATGWDPNIENDFSLAIPNLRAVDIVTVNSDIYVALNDARTGTSGRLVKWTASTQTWADATNGGVNGSISALVAYGSTIYVAGVFSSAGSSTTVHDVAAYSTGPGIWSTVGTAAVGLNSGGIIRSMAYAYDGFAAYLYVGGNFTSVGGVSASNVARRNFNGSYWDSMNGGVTPYGVDVVSTIVATTGVAYVGGNFHRAGVTNIGLWNSSYGVWTGFGQGVESDTPLRGETASVENMCKNSSGRIFMTGIFNGVNGTIVNPDHYGVLASIDKAQISPGNVLTPWYPNLTGDTTSSPDYQICRGPIVAVGNDVYCGHSSNASIHPTAIGGLATTIVRIDGSTGAVSDYTSGGLPNGLIKMVYGSAGFCVITDVNTVQRYQP